MENRLIGRISFGDEARYSSNDKFMYDPKCARKAPGPDGNRMKPLPACVAEKIPKTELRGCDRHGCPVLADGMVRMNIPAAGYEKDAIEPLRLPVPLFLCQHHVLLANALDFQTPEWRTQMRQVLKNRGSQLSPDFENAWLDLMPISTEA